MSLFHAYIIAGEKEDTRAHIQSLLDESKVAEVLHSDHVTFSREDAETIRQWQSTRASSPRAYLSFFDFITLDAQQALLKTLEEPTEHTHIFLCTSNPDVLLPTLQSRVQIVRVGQESGLDFNIPSFIRMSIPERLAFVSDMLVKEDDEDASALLRQKVLTFLNTLETHLAKDAQKYKEVLKKILELKKYVYIPGSSMRLILETVVLSF